MLKKVFVGVLVVIMALTFGCVNFNNNIQPTTNAAGFVERQAQYYNVTWISPTDVWIGNYYAGATAEYTLTVHNGKDVIVSMKVDAICANDTIDGYNLAPIKVLDWVYISDSSFLLQGKETKEVLVTLAMPKGESIEFDKWEFRVTVFEQGQGNIQKGTATRCFVDMK